MPLPSNAHLNWHPFVGYCRHEDMLPPAGLPMMLNYIDFGVVNGITGLFAWPTAHFPFPPGRKPHRGGILDMGVPMQGHGTDATLIVMHVPVPFTPGYLLGLLILFGSSQIVMASNRTRIWCKGVSGLTGELEQAVGCCVFPYVPVSLNLQCWDFKVKKWNGNISAPVLSDIVIAPNTVQVGVGLADYTAMLLEWGIDVALAVLLAFATKTKTKAPKPPTTSKKWYKKALDKKWAKKWMVGIGVKLPFKLLVKNTEWFRDSKGDVSGWTRRELHNG